MLSTERPPLLDRTSDWLDQHARPYGPTTIAVGLVVLYLVSLAWAWQHVSYDVWGALLISPLLVALIVPLGIVAARHEEDASMVRLVIEAFVLKLFMAIVRYAVAFGVYGGTADAAVYHQVGRALAKQFRSGDFRTMGEPLTGTGFLKVLTGAVYTISGPTKLGGFLIFAWMSFIGLWLFYRAFRLAMPDGNHRRYALLIFFLPSMLFWSSSIGKDAWMCLTLGVATYGAARMLVHRRGGLVLFMLGTALGAFVRPHVSLILFLAVSVAYLVRRPTRRAVLGPAGKVVGLLVLVVVGSLLLNRVEDQLGVEDLQSGGVDQALSLVTERSDEGGSSFETVPPTSPIGFVRAVSTVLFRPFPFEAGNAQALLASMEGVALLGAVLLCAGNGLRLAQHVRSWPFGMIALTYVLVFCYAFASVGNFGILTRQRVQVLPFLLVLLCLPTEGERNPLRTLTRRRGGATPVPATP